MSAQLYVLEAWFDAEHAEARPECGVPQDLVYKTKPQIALELLQAAVRRGSLPFRWVAADELYGDSPAFRDGVAALEGKWHFTEINETTLLWQTRPEVYVPTWKGRGSDPTHFKLRYPEDTPIPVRDLLKLLPKTAWTRAIIKEGSKGPIVCDFAFLRVVEARVGLPGPDLWLVIRRNLEHPSAVKFYFSKAPSTPPVTEFVRVSGLRWPIETLFEESKGEVGLDHYENRSWLGWPSPHAPRRSRSFLPGADAVSIPGTSSSFDHLPNARLGRQCSAQAASGCAGGLETGHVLSETKFRCPPVASKNQAHPTRGFTRPCAVILMDKHKGTRMINSPTTADSHANYATLFVFLHK